VAEEGCRRLTGRKDHAQIRTSLQRLVGKLATIDLWHRHICEQEFHLRMLGEA
jgi:hypothetical protein